MAAAVAAAAAVVVEEEEEEEEVVVEVAPVPAAGGGGRGGRCKLPVPRTCGASPSPNPSPHATRAEDTWSAESCDSSIFISATVLLSFSSIFWRRLESDTSSSTRRAPT